MRSIRWLPLLVPVLAVLMAAAPRSDMSAEDMIRAGNAALVKGDFDKAEEWYTSAEERTTDPGMVAFNKANALFHRERYSEAEKHYTRALDDSAAPPERRTAALYNRGVCLIKQDGAQKLQKLRAAIDSFDRCLALAPADTALVADARHNLELAKLLWMEARAKEQKKSLPNEQPDPPPEPRPERPSPPTVDPSGQPDNLTSDRGQPAGGAPEPIRGGPNGANPRNTDERAPGKGNAPVITGEDKLPPDLTPQQIRAYLEDLSARVAKDRRNNAFLTAPPERPNVKDW